MKIQTLPPSAETVSSPEEVQKEQLKKVSKQFESLFVNQMVGAMRKTVNKSGLYPESQAEKVYQNMLDTEYAQKISDTGQLGLSSLIYDHLMRQMGRNVK